MTPPAVLGSALLMGALLFGACTGNATERDDRVTPAFATRTVEAGDVTVKITPLRIDTDGAEFAVALETHFVELDLDLSRAARLVVDGSDWPAGGWDGAPAGGHHREGTLRFAAGGQANEEAGLAIEGLPGPVTARWRLAGD